MNKKLVIGIIAGVVALIIIAVSAVAILKHFDVNILGGDKESSSDVSSSQDAGDNTSSANSESGTTVVERGNIKTPDIKTSADEIVKIPVKLNSNPGVWGCQFNFDYDTDVFEYVDYENGNIFDECDVNVKDGVIRSITNLSGLENTNKNGTVITINLKVKSDAKKGTYKLKLRDDSQVVNIEEQVVSPKIEIGSITVK